MSWPKPFQGQQTLAQVNMEDPHLFIDDVWRDEEAKHKAEELVPELLTLSKQHTASALRIGEHLLDIKRTCIKRGMFGDWCDEFYKQGGIHKRSAQRFMALAEAFHGNHAAVSPLTLELLGKLSKKSVPQEIRDNVISKLEAGTQDAVADAISYAEEKLSQKAIAAAKVTDHSNDAPEDDHDEGVPEDADNDNVYPSDAVDSIVTAIKSSLSKIDGPLTEMIEAHGIEPLVRLIVRKLKDDQPGSD